MRTGIRRRQRVGMALAWVALLACCVPAAIGQSDQAARSRTEVSRTATAEEIRLILTVPSGAGAEVSLVAPVPFRVGSATLTSVAQALLGRLADAMLHESLAGTRFVLEGHTDASGSAAYNLELSKRRAESVFDFLVLRGVALERLSVKAYGESRPLPGVHPYDASNRRVEVVRLH